MALVANERAMWSKTVAGIVHGRWERKRKATKTRRAVDETSMLRQKIKAKNQVMGALLEHVKHYCRFLVCDTQAGGAHSGDYSSAAVSDSDDR